MTGLVAAVRLDVLTVRPYARQLLLVVAAVAWIALMSGPPTAVVASGSVFAALVAAYPFAIGDKHDLDTLRAVLPVARGTHVRARYAGSLALYVVALAVCVALALGTSVARHTPPALGELGTVVAVGYALYALLVGLQLPVYYALGYTRGRMVAYLPLVVLSAAVAGSAAVLGDRAPDLDAWLTTRPASLVPALLVGGTALLVLSCAVSLRLDARRAAQQR
ncbi:ABC-2 transporter permease [Cellulomonas fimi]|uniref:ABC-2 transporter permease n=1 Tax=Cellulomonas fimi (strain ATCC 484 / DSM 20113 / JCM 1341 / CCUG 24087 / LMG 16345 / NBRC 15513 / NCIMB 8980 / NCTC 7547 / NRS-133) TaxID=590998 RepID=F4H6B4_CELFA|nr:ABC-2 transporter permease [Cellulomonas fimi]AEE44426.1 hypothetical protein Celf_0281 [Cellulomonas fimi ATCC 484]NNH08317.1 ABC-2 transporter permease [Cellulomonas fimi]VEH26338.1 Uncharacterised protein [Cellulomonas fimi]